jgi:hypothetical protein
MSEEFDREKLARLASFCPAFEAEDFRFGSWTELRRDEDGAVLMPEFIPHATALEFLDVCYADEWIRQDFSWVEWKDSREATSLRDDPNAIAAASLDQLSKLITVIVRQDRFAEGTLANAFETGLITRILSRLATISTSPDWQWK